MNIREKLLLTAIRRNDVEVILELIKDFDLTQPLFDNTKLMKFAVANSSFDVIEKIARNKKTDPNDKAEYGYALLYAVLGGRLETARILLEAGASHRFCLNIQRRFRGFAKNDSCLHIAVKNKDLAMIALLLHFGFDTTLRNDDSYTPIQEAAFEIFAWDCVKVLITLNNKPTSDDLKAYCSILERAVEIKKLDIVTLLLKAGVRQKDLSKDSIKRLDSAVGFNSSGKMMELLVSFGFDFSKVGFAAGRRALYNKVCLKVEEKKNFRMALFVVLQSLRQPSSAFSKLPGDFSALIMSYLCLPKVSPEGKIIPQNAIMEARRKLALTENEMIKHSAACFLTTSSRFFRWHSETSEAFLAKMQAIVESDSGTMKSDVAEAVSEFKTNMIEGSGTFTRLTAYKLDNLLDSKKKNDDIRNTVKAFLTAYDFVINPAPESKSQFPFVQLLSGSEPFKQLLREFAEMVEKSCSTDDVSHAVGRFLETGPDLKLIKLLERYGIIKTIEPVTIHTQKLGL